MRARLSGPSVVAVCFLLACADPPPDDTPPPPAPGGGEAQPDPDDIDAASDPDDVEAALEGTHHEPGRRYVPCPRGSHLVVGTDGDDVLAGTEGADCIVGLGGNDRISANGGVDVVFPGDGDDVVEGGPGNDFVHGSRGNDQIAGGGGRDLLLGGSGNDLLLGGADGDVVYGGLGNDAIRGDGGFDLLWGGRGDDALADTNGAGVLGGPGTDWCAGWECERPPVPIDDTCEPGLPACGTPPCCSVLGPRLACLGDADCDDAEPCTADRCQPAVGCFNEVIAGCAECPISWQPSAVAPVFYGHRDFDVADGAPGPMRVFFPSLDGSPSTAPMLLGCGRYPLVLMAHGNCPADPDHHLAWFVPPASLARSGNVVVVPLLPGISSTSYPWEGDGDSPRIRDALRWMRTSWDHRGALLPGSTGIVGHSWGALAGARFALESVGTAEEISAYASLSGTWDEWSGARPIDALAIPKLFVWGTGGIEATHGLDTIWPFLPTPKHRTAIADAEHFDYLSEADGSVCAPFRGPCTHAQTLAREQVHTFFAKYLPPERWASLRTGLPDTLLLPPLDVPPFDLTLDQEFFAGAHRNAEDLFAASAECSAELAFEADTTGTATVP